MAFTWTCSLVTPACLQANYLLVEEQMSEMGYEEGEQVRDCIKRPIYYASVDQEKCRREGEGLELMVVLEDTRVWCDILICVSSPCPNSDSVACLCCCREGLNLLVHPYYLPAHRPDQTQAWPITCQLLLLCLNSTCPSLAKSQSPLTIHSSTSAPRLHTLLQPGVYLFLTLNPNTFCVSDMTIYSKKFRLELKRTTAGWWAWLF